MVYRNLLCVLFAYVFSMGAFAATDVSDMWLSIPSEIVPYVNLNQRKEIIESHKLGVEASASNLLEGVTRMDTLAADYGKFTLSSSRYLELGLLPVEGADSVLLVIDTFCGPEKKSVLKMYDSQWKPLPINKFIPLIHADSLLARPDSITQSRFAELCAMVNPRLIFYSYDSSSCVLSAELSMPFTTNEEKRHLNNIVRKELLKWDGESFTKVK